MTFAELSIDEIWRRIGANLRRARNKTGMSQEIVGQIGIVSVRYYREIEAGQHNVSGNKVVLLARLFKTDPPTIMDVSKSVQAGEGEVEHTPRQQRPYEMIAEGKRRVADLLQQIEAKRKTKPKKRKK